MKKPWSEVLRLTFSWFLFALIACTLVQTYTVSANGQATQEKSRAIVLVIDKSGSMREQNKMHYVTELVKSIGRQLSESDYLGVVVFDISPFVVIELEQVERLRQQDVISKQMERLKPGGQTYFLPALEEAKRRLERVSAAQKDIVLLSDGVTRGTQGELIDSVVAIKKLAIRVSTIALGADAGIGPMRRIASFGGGSFQFFCNPSDLAQVTLESILSGTGQLGEFVKYCP
jgi:uncharacterized protein with von Willebrand factor type A (vWA) domain